MFDSDEVLKGKFDALFLYTLHIGCKAVVGTRKNRPYNQYGLISDVTMEGPGEGVEGLILVEMGIWLHKFND